jgi:aryl-alcohol dehydrogenase-like predicted oxidoreductase
MQSEIDGTGLIVLIPGASKVSSVRDSARASAIKMAQEDLAAIDWMPDG